MVLRQEQEMFSESSLRQLLPLHIGFPASSSVHPITATTLLWSYLVVPRSACYLSQVLYLFAIFTTWPYFALSINPTPTNDA